MRSNISVVCNSPSNPSPELYQIYYLFAFSAVGRQLIPFLRKLGLNFTEFKHNPAQGTVSTLIFFENVYLEIFWFESTSYLAQSDMVEEFNFPARVNWLETGASPFGFGLSYPTTNYDNFAPATVEAISPGARRCAIAKDEIPISEPLLGFCPINLANPEEPICYFVPDYEAKRNRLDRSLAISSRWHCVIAEGTRNPGLGMRKLTHLKIRVISDQLSLALRDRVLTPPSIDLGAQKLLEIEYRKHPLLDLTFDDGNQKRFVDLRPLIPIILRY